jgi:hypothetical protein
LLAVVASGTCGPERETKGETTLTRKRSLAGAIALVAVAAMVAAGAIYASSGDDGRSQGANEIIGSWELTVDRGPQLPPVKGLTTYTRGHSVVGSANVPTRGAAHGTWEHVSGRLYADTHVFFRFDATGAFLGTQRVNETARLAPDGESYTSVAISNLFDPNGNLVVGGLRATVTAKRIHVDRIPDQP